MNYKRLFVMLSTCSMILLINLDATIVNMAIPNIARSLGESISIVQWLITGYFLTAGVFFIICGKLADIFNKKSIMLFGISCFLIASLGIFIYQNVWMIISLRMIQGIGFAAVLNLALMINAEIFPPEKRGFILGVSITTSGVGQAFGPIIAGNMLMYLNWHYLFLINIPLCLLALIGISVFYREALAANDSVKLTSRSVFTIKEYPSLLLVRGNFTLSWAVLFFCIPIYLQNYLMYSAFHSGAIIFTMTAIFGIVSIVVGYYLDIFGYKKLLVIAMLFGISAFFLIIIALISNHITIFLIGIGCFGFYSGIMIPTTVFVAMKLLPEQQRGLGMGLFFTISFLAAASGTFIASRFLNTGFSIGHMFEVILIALLLCFVVSIGLGLRRLLLGFTQNA